MHALVIANADDADTGCVGHHLRLRGYELTECHREHPTGWPSLAGFDMVLMLGSEWSVYWPEVAVSVQAEAALVRTAAEGGLPVLGICFGSQVVAHALGGSVQPAPTPEVGWYEVDTIDPRVVAAGPWLQWHYDVVTLPPGAEELARSPVGPQAWRLGRTFCTQFHPEATETIVSRWVSGAGGEELARLGSSRHRMLADTAANVAVSTLNAERLVDWFLDSVAG